MFDCLVVGAGSAGAILATRLSERSDVRVLLLEAGPDYVDEQTTPQDLLDSRNLAGLAHDWYFTAIPVPGRTITYRRGRVTGGTSAINAAAALWGGPADFDRWAQLGNTQWRWADHEVRFSSPAPAINGPEQLPRLHHTRTLALCGMCMQH